MPKLPTNKFRIIERVNAHIFDGLFYALNYHFAVFSKMMHIKDTVEVATCCANYGCLSRLHFALWAKSVGVLANLGNGGRSCVLYNCRNAKILTVMKQTVSIFAPDINVASKSSAIQLWLNRKTNSFLLYSKRAYPTARSCCLAMPPLFSLH